MKRHLLAAAAVAVLAITTSTASANDTIVVTPETPQGWYFTNDHTAETGVVTATTGTGGITEDEVGGSTGTGSYLLEVTTTSQKARVETQQFNSLTLGELVSFAYSTHKTGMTGYAPSINIMIDPAGSGSFDGADDFATLVWEANKAGQTITDGKWQDWDTTATGGWWSPSVPAGSPGNTNAPTQLDRLVEHFGADSPVLSVAVNVGRHGPMTAHVDDVAVTTTQGTTRFDFEMGRTPASAEDCKGGGWMQFNAPVFQNQGDCVSYLKSAR